MTSYFGINNTCSLLRFANAFSYYGLVLLTTELFQEGGACGSKSCHTVCTVYKTMI